MWRFRKGGLRSRFLIYGIFLNCLGYGVEWGAGLWMMDFEGFTLAEGAVAGQHSFARLEWRRELKSSLRMTHRTCTVPQNFPNRQQECEKPPHQDIRKVGPRESCTCLHTVVFIELPRRYFDFPCSISSILGQVIYKPVPTSGG
jgi:hypothetical protein